MTLFVFFLILSVLVLVHELGHFVVAKRNGIRVEEFGFGIPPKIWSKKFGETTYSINLLPFGGFVKLSGEDAIESSKDPRNFMSKTPGQRFRVLFAGVFMNLILALVLWSGYFIFNNFKTAYIPLPFDYDFVFGQQANLNTVVGDIMEGSGAERSSLKVGDAILSIDGKEVQSVIDIREAIADKLGTPVLVEVIDLTSQTEHRDSFYVTPQPDEAGNPVLGVLLTGATKISYDGPFQRVAVGLLHSVNVLDYSGFALKELIAISVQTKNSQPVSDNIAGPVGIYSIVDTILKSSNTKSILLSLVDYTALMSLSLAFINLLPIPALDGGRILFVVLEKLLSRPVNQKLEAMAHRVGMILLLGLLILITIKDIGRFF